MNNKQLLGTIFCLILSFTSLAQKAVKAIPEEGKKMPDFKLTEIMHYSKTKASLKDFKGKWLVLDFWFSTCHACIASFPKMSKMQEEFKDSVQFIMVGMSDSKYNKRIREIYERHREKYDLQLAAAYDSVLYSKWEIISSPYLIIIDPTGMVRGITAYQLNPTTMRQLMAGEDVGFSTNPYDEVNSWLPLFAQGNGGADTNFIYRSLIAKWDKLFPQCPVSIDAYNAYVNSTGNKYRNGLQGTGMHRWWLYNYAYFGKYQWIYGDPIYGKVSLFPLVLIKDTMLFASDSKSRTGMFDYSLLVPKEKASTDNIKKIMQHDLENYFGFKAAVEVRKLPCWKLVAAAQAPLNLRSKGGVGKEEDMYTAANPNFINVPIDILLRSIASFYPWDDPFIDDTGINYNVDLKLEAVMNDLDDVKAALRRHGLDLIRGEKEMKVLVIRDGN